ncbi:MAG: tRNA-dihydrouridine synthase family protein [Christensenellaceae bacterium]|jgi:nifR3 family TIM-barrel protein|nr:tRNA-dihydrouridine synthase family protein [Christensenellaceae bacterium]
MLVECAPIAGYTTFEFRKVLRSLGAKVLWTEMVSAAAIFYKNKKTLKLLEHETVDGIKNVVQLFGHVPEHFKFAIESGVLDGFDEININMGCPANKIIKNNEGVALMNKPDLAREIIETATASISSLKNRNRLSHDSAPAGDFRFSMKPVTVSVKMRLGVKEPFDCAAFAKMCESAGASRLIVHGRYAEQGYSGKADWNAIAEIVRAVKIPVIANGDIKTLDDAKKCLEITGATGVMVGRALLPIYRKYFPTNLRILRGEKISRDADIDIRSCDVCGLFAGGAPQTP